MSKTGKILASTVGAAAAAGVTLAALRKMEGLPPFRAAPETVFRVTPDGDDGGWEISADTAEAPRGRYATKRAALDRARDLAHESAPSRLVIHRADGTIQRQHTYPDPGA